MKKDQKIPLIYIVGMPIILIIANSIANFHIKTLGGSYIFISVILYPLTYLISGLIIRKSGYKDALQIMAVSLVSAALEGVFTWALLDNMQPLVMIYSFLSFLICQLIFIYVFDYLIKIKKDTYMPVFLLVLTVLVIDHCFYGFIIEGKIISMSILIRALYASILPALLATKK